MLYQAGRGFSKLKIGSLCWQLGNLQPQFQPNWPKVTYDCQIWPRQAAISPGTTTCLLHFIQHTNHNQLLTDKKDLTG